METRICLALAALPVLLTCVTGHAQKRETPSPMTTAKPLPLSAVRLLEGPFKQAMERDGRYLLSLEPDRLLHNFRKNAGLEPKAPIYGGWEKEGVAGHTLGHYLSACSQMYASTGERRFKERVDAIVEELALCQKQRKDGYVAGIPDCDRVWAEIARGEIRTQPFDLNGIWVPWYTLHKLFAGLLDAHALCGSKPALAVATRLGDWAVEVTKKLTDDQWQQMLAAEHGGMNESMAELYVRTKKPEFLELSRKFHHRAVLDPLERGEDRLDGRHGNTQIPKLIGVARRYEVTGEESLRRTAAFFWERVALHRSYVIGGHGDGEYFFPIDQFGAHLSPVTAETCNTYNMLKLTLHVFGWQPSAQAMDFYERALCNQILASQEPRQGMMTYFVPLKPGHFKVYNSPEDSFWCCTGTGIENHAKYGEGIYSQGADSLYVNLFIPSELKWKAKGVTLRQETRFPEEDTTRLTVTASRPRRFALKIRKPAWAREVTVKVNGEDHPVQPGEDGYLALERTWKNGDVVEVRLAMELRLEPLPRSNRAAILYGPVVLAGEMGAEGLPDLIVPSQTQLNGLPSPQEPVLVADQKELLRRIEPVDGKPLTFRTKEIGRPGDYTLSPFFRLHYQRYNIYWPVLSEEEWRQRAAEIAAAEAARKALDARIVDEVRPGEQQPEVDHALKHRSSRTGDFGGRKWRDAPDGGWFSYDLKVEPDRPQTLRCTYWGSDAGGRTFDILVNGVKIATQTLANDRPGKFFDVDHPLPAELLRGMAKVTIRFQAHPGNIAGGLFGLMVLRDWPPPFPAA